MEDKHRHDHEHEHSLEVNLKEIINQLKLLNKKAGKLMSLGDEMLVATQQAAAFLQEVNTDIDAMLALLQAGANNPSGLDQTQSQTLLTGLTTLRDGLAAAAGKFPTPPPTVIP
jgi:hypothetical protein